MLSHRGVRMSIVAAAACVLLALPAAAGSASAYLGRWTVAEDKALFSAKGRLYKTVDVARCGADMCGVSVADNGACGPLLFRFHATTLVRNETARGHGRWGAVKKNIELTSWQVPDVPGGRRITIDLGDGYDFGERSGNMPKFSAQYRVSGRASCVAR